MSINHSFFVELKRIEDEKKIKLIAVSKFQDIDKIKALYEMGQVDFGENYVQEMVLKAKALPYPIVWHFIGHLQSKKVKDLVPYVSCIQSVDSLKLLEEIQKRAFVLNRRIKVLLQLKVAQEESKYGMAFEVLEELVRVYVQTREKFLNIEVCGIMGMSTLTEDMGLVKQEFGMLKAHFDDLKVRYFKEDGNFKELSMGMSGDYGLAIENGSTMIRIGSSIFGQRASQ